MADGHINGFLMISFANKLVLTSAKNRHQVFLNGTNRTSTMIH